MIRRLAMLWVYLYTAGLTQDQKARRRTEIQSDMYEQQAFATGVSGGSVALGRSFGSRMARGMMADLLWRLEEGRDGEQVVRAGGDPPLPWFTMWFVAAVIVAGCAASTQVEALGDTRVLWAVFAASGAGISWLGLYLATHRLAGPACIAIGAACVALGLWWTVVVPLAAVCLGVSGLRRAQRLDALLHGDA